MTGKLTGGGKTEKRWEDYCDYDGGGAGAHRLRQGVRHGGTERDRGCRRRAGSGRFGGADETGALTAQDGEIPDTEGAEGEPSDEGEQGGEMMIPNDGKGELISIQATTLCSCEIKK